MKEFAVEDVVAAARAAGVPERTMTRMLWYLRVKVLHHRLALANEQLRAIRNTWTKGAAVKRANIMGEIHSITSDLATLQGP